MGEGEDFFLDPPSPILYFSIGPPPPSLITQLLVRPPSLRIIYGFRLYFLYRNTAYDPPSPLTYFFLKPPPLIHNYCLDPPSLLTFSKKSFPLYPFKCNRP